MVAVSGPTKSRLGNHLDHTVKPSIVPFLLAGLLTQLTPLIAAEAPAETVELVDQLMPLKPYSGWDALEQIRDTHQRDAFKANWHLMEANYLDSVDFQLRKKVTILNENTTPIIYGNNWPVAKYRAGSRPELEAIAFSVTKDCVTQQQKALALMRYVRNIYRNPSDPGAIQFGGTEEQLIARGDGLCEGVSRLLVGLAETVGMPGRIIIHIIGGHLVAEILVNGKWGYIDSRSGLYFLKPDGTLASAWEIYRDPALLGSQSEAVVNDVSPRWRYADLITQLRNEYFHPKELLGVVNYSLESKNDYNFPIYSMKEVRARGLTELSAAYRKATEAVFYPNK